MSIKAFVRNVLVSYTELPNILKKSVKNIMEELRIILTPYKQHKNVLLNVPVAGFWNGKSLKDYLVRAKISKLEESGRCERYGKKTCLLKITYLLCLFLFYVFNF